ncbi:hypothetical protein PUNSTDRAFT_133172 [Punctularia strigosozonata HHB-11173 SS5]|uniref:uncharacterized protein n=1 Tax=Punctularia strigosozonata (strain HHB-11173) TaxID=741275 RepID=UPI00044176A2|nr:uncharacterized protein PUNSTDRAFT_133172 [Punctularia strigosozonata HHB-11173 SS5]EIN11123.1 hypothetical protein PUNSTDRAFT_133172 [Punctularia strigosozonata HHB-11173 SS5]
MPIVNFTIPDSSPWITYSPAGAWGDSDLATQLYTNGTFHFTQVAGASANFAFNGSGVWLYGAQRPNHNVYTVALDGVNSTANGHTDENPGVFNFTLFSSPASGLTLGHHQVSLINTPTSNGYVDIDWAVIEVGDGSTNTISNDFWLDDTSANFTFDKNWSVGKNSLSPQYYNSTFFLANAPNAAATLTFFGNAVSVYGATSGNHGPYSVSLDGLPGQNYNGSQIHFRPQMLLYYASGLPTTQHSLVLTNTGNGSTFTDIDFAIVSRWDSDVALAGALQPTTTTSSIPSTRSVFTTPIGTLPGRQTTTSISSSVSASTTTSNAGQSMRVVNKGGLISLCATFALVVLPFATVL